MRTNLMGGMVFVGIGFALGAVTASAAPQPAAVALSEHGEKLEAQYASAMTALQTKLAQAVPQVNEQQKAAFKNAVAAEKAAEAALNEARKNLGKVGTAHALVAHAKGKWIGGAEKSIAQAEKMLQAATTDAQREAAKKELVKWQANKADGIKALHERQAALEQAQREEPSLHAAVAKAEKALAEAKAQIMQAVKSLDIKAALSSDKLDAALARYVVLREATPTGLAAFAQQSPAHEALVKKLFSDPPLIKQMLIADGASEGKSGPAKYGEAMKIYTEIQKASPKAKEGVLQRLALAVALEHAVPIAQSNPSAETSAPAFVDPVNRYLHYEKAFLDGELDPAFENLSVWDYRMVVDGDEPDWTSAWGREMLRNYRPDQITLPDYRWRYVQAVASEVCYGSQDVKYDLPTLQNYQNIIMNGGICGRRAFFGRFILRAFGIPTTARPQRGHAALAHWTPDGWVICLGAGWGNGWTHTRYKNDLDFLATTQARVVGEPFLQVKRAQWFGDVLGEPRTFGLNAGEPAFWNGVALYTQREIIHDSKAKTLDAVGTDLGEANESKKKEVVPATTVTDADRKIVVGPDGAITIPVAACSKPARSTGKIRFTESVLGGMQLHYGRTGGAEDFVYTFDAPAAGKYTLTARIVTTSANQHLQVAANKAQRPTNIAVPFTVGRWEKTPSVEVTLIKGTNVLRFSRQEPVKGLTIKDFTLTPVK